MDEIFVASLSVCVSLFRASSLLQPFAKWHQAKSILSHAMKILHLMTLFLRITLVSFIPHQSAPLSRFSPVSPLYGHFFHRICWFFFHSVCVAAAILDIVSQTSLSLVYTDTLGLVCGMVHWWMCIRAIWLFARLSHRCCVCCVCVCLCESELMSATVFWCLVLIWHSHTQ